MRIFFHTLKNKLFGEDIASSKHFYRSFTELENDRIKHAIKILSFIFRSAVARGKIVCKRQRLPAFRTAKNSMQDYEARMKSMNETKAIRKLFRLEEMNFYNSIAQEKPKLTKASIL